MWIDWILWGMAAYVAVAVLVRLMTNLQRHLMTLLTDYVKRQKGATNGNARTDQPVT